MEHINHNCMIATINKKKLTSTWFHCGFHPLKLIVNQAYFSKHYVKLEPHRRTHFRKTPPPVQPSRPHTGKIFPTARIYPTIILLSTRPRTLPTMRPINSASASLNPRCSTYPARPTSFLRRFVARFGLVFSSKSYFLYFRPFGLRFYDSWEIWPKRDTKTIVKK